MTKVAKSSKCIIHLFALLSVPFLIPESSFSGEEALTVLAAEVTAVQHSLGSTGNFDIQTSVQTELCWMIRYICIKQIRRFSRPREEHFQKFPLQTQHNIGTSH